MPNLFSSCKNKILSKWLSILARTLRYAVQVVFREKGGGRCLGSSPRLRGGRMMLCWGWEQEEISRRCHVYICFWYDLKTNTNYLYIICSFLPSMKTKRESKRKRGNAAASACGLPLVPLGGAGSAREPHSVLRASVLWESACLLRKVAGWWLRPGCPTPGGGKPCTWVEERCSLLLLISSTNCYPSSTRNFIY